MAAADMLKLEREKFSLLKEVAVCSDASRELQAKLEHLRARKEAKVKDMAEASAMFLHGKDKEKAELTVKDSQGRLVTKTVVVQPMGRRDAVSQTRRRIAKQADQLRKECSVTETRHNKIQMRIKALKEQINLNRQEGQIFDKTFESVHQDLLRVKEDIALQKRHIQHCYAMRDVARQEGRAAIDRMKADRAHALMQFEMGDHVIKEANASDVQGAVGEDGELSKEQEEMLRQRIKQSNARAQAETVKIHRMKLKQAVFEDAIEAVLEHTGCATADDVVVQLNKFEEEKFERAAAVTRTMEEIEAVEKEVSGLKDEYTAKQRARDSVVLQKARTMEEASAEVDKVTKQLQQQAEHRSKLQASIEATLEQVRSLFSEAAPEAAAEADALGSSSSIDAIAASASRASVSSQSNSASVQRKRSTKRRRRSSVATVSHIQRGVSIASLPSFLEAIEDGVSRLVQKYAVAASDPSQIAAAAVTSKPRLEASPMPGKLASSRSARFLLSPASPEKPKPAVQLGPSVPRGALSQSLTSSALMVAMLDVVQSKTEEDVDERPLSLDEMKAEAARTLESGAFKAARKASQDTARLLDSKQRGRGTGMSSTTQTGKHG